MLATAGKGERRYVHEEKSSLPHSSLESPPPLALNSFPAPSCGDAHAAKEDKSDDRPVFLSISILEKKWASQMSLPGNGPR